MCRQGKAYKKKRTATDFDSVVFGTITGASRHNATHTSSNGQIHHHRKRGQGVLSFLPLCLLTVVRSKVMAFFFWRGFKKEEARSKLVLLVSCIVMSS